MLDPRSCRTKRLAWGVWPWTFRYTDSFVLRTGMENVNITVIGNLCLDVSMDLNHTADDHLSEVHFFLFWKCLEWQIWFANLTWWRIDFPSVVILFKNIFICIGLKVLILVIFRVFLSLNWVLCSSILHRCPPDSFKLKQSCPEEKRVCYSAHGFKQHQQKSSNMMMPSVLSCPNVSSLILSAWGNTGLTLPSSLSHQHFNPETKCHFSQNMIFLWCCL